MMIDQPKLPTKRLIHFRVCSSGTTSHAKIPKSIARTIWVSTAFRMSKSFGPRKNGMFIAPGVVTL